MNNTREIIKTDSIADAMQHIGKTENAVCRCRAFLTEHQDKLQDLYFRCYGWDAEITFSGYQFNLSTPRDIAKRFGADGWERVAKASRCGAFDWVKTVDGVRLIIESAETLDPKFKKEVRIE